MCIKSSFIHFDILKIDATNSLIFFTFTNSNLFNNLKTLIPFPTRSSHNILHTSQQKRRGSTDVTLVHALTVNVSAEALMRAFHSKQRLRLCSVWLDRYEQHIAFGEPSRLL